MSYGILLSPGGTDLTRGSLRANPGGLLTLVLELKEELDRKDEDIQELKLDFVGTRIHIHHPASDGRRLVGRRPHKTTRTSTFVQTAEVERCRYNVETKGFDTSSQGPCMAKTVVVTGAHGGVGSWVVKELRAEYDVIAVDLSVPEMTAVDGVRFQAVDLTD